MNADRRLSTALHALLHLAGPLGPRRSEDLARCLGTNAVVVRQVLAGLREAGLVEATRGRGGGWSLRRELARITVRDVHRALGEPAMLVVGLRGRGPGCRVEGAVNAALAQAAREAEASLRAQLDALTLADLAREASCQAPGPHQHPLPTR